jgi:hypothetical protein
MKRTALALCLFFVIVAPLILLTQSNLALASIPKPSVPEFNVKLIDSSYIIPATTTTDPYTGQTVTHPSQRIEARTIEIRIKNIPFTPFEIKNGSNIYNAQFCYNIRFKGHFEEEWHEAYNPNVNGLLGRDSGIETVFSRQGEYSSIEGLKLTAQGMYTTFPPNAQIDFQVEAMIGYIHHVIAMPFSADVFEGQTSGWSNTQTLTIPASSTPEIPEFPSGIILPLLIIVAIGVGLLVHFKKRKH